MDTPAAPSGPLDHPPVDLADAADAYEEHAVVAAATARDTWPVRRAVLRPGANDDELDFPGDHDDTTLHVVAFAGDDGHPVGCCSIYREARGNVGDRDQPGHWRIRGMATLPQVRGTGLGEAMLLFAIAHARAERAQLVWCNARTPAVGFYARHGFVTVGDEFDIPGIGPHYVMELTTDDPGNTTDG